MSESNNEVQIKFEKKFISLEKSITSTTINKSQIINNIFLNVENNMDSV